jgi:hypothetical protein
MEGLDEEDDYMGLGQYIRNGENGSRSTYRKKFISEGGTSEGQVVVLKVPEGGVNDEKAFSRVQINVPAEAPLPLTPCTPEMYGHDHDPQLQL